MFQHMKLFIRLTPSGTTRTRDQGHLEEGLVIDLGGGRDEYAAIMDQPHHLQTRLCWLTSGGVYQGGERKEEKAGTITPMFGVNCDNKPRQQ